MTDINVKSMIIGVVEFKYGIHHAKWVTCGNKQDVCRVASFVDHLVEY